MSKGDFKKKSKDLKFLLFISGFNYQSCCSFLLPLFPSPQPPCLDATTLQRTAAFRRTVGLLPLILMLYKVKDGQKHLETLAIWIVQLKTGCSRATAPSLALWITCTPQFSWRHFANGYFCRLFFHPIIALWLFYAVSKTGTHLIYAAGHNISPCLNYE